MQIKLTLLTIFSLVTVFVNAQCSDINEAKLKLSQSKPQESFKILKTVEVNFDKQKASLINVYPITTFALLLHTSN